MTAVLGGERFTRAGIESRFGIEVVQADVETDQPELSPAESLRLVAKAHLHDATANTELTNSYTVTIRDMGSVAFTAVRIGRELEIIEVSNGSLIVNNRTKAQHEQDLDGSYQEVYTSVTLPISGRAFVYEDRTIFLDDKRIGEIEPRRLSTRVGERAMQYAEHTIMHISE